MEPDQIYAALNDAYFSEHPHEEAVIAHLGRLVHDECIVADIGASLGQYTLAASKRIRNGTIVAVEADPVRYAELSRNCERWAEMTGNMIVARHAAVTDREGSVTFYTTNTNVSGSLEAGGGEPVSVPAITLDSLFPDRLPDFVKIDVEGAELSVLAGATRLLRSGRATFLVEIHGDGREPLLRLMAEHGYRRTLFYGQTLFTRSLLRWFALTAPIAPRILLGRLTRRMRAE